MHGPGHGGLHTAALSLGTNCAGSRKTEQTPLLGGGGVCCTWLLHAGSFTEAHLKQRKMPRWLGERGVTFDVAVHYAMLVEDVDGDGDLLGVQPDDVLLQAQPGHLLQRALVAVLHEDVHLFLREERNAAVCSRGREAKGLERVTGRAPEGRSS